MTSGVFNIVNNGQFEKAISCNSIEQFIVENAPYYQVTTSCEFTARVFNGGKGIQFIPYEMHVTQPHGGVLYFIER